MVHIVVEREYDTPFDKKAWLAGADILPDEPGQRIY